MSTAGGPTNITLQEDTRYKFETPEQAYRAAQRAINNALRRKQESLSLSGYGLTAVPSGIGNLSTLKILNLEQNRLSVLSPEICGLAALENLVLAQNRLTTLPREIGNLRTLQHLDLGLNLLSTLPEEIGELVALKWLYLVRNQFSSLPPNIGRLVALEQLHLDKNQLKALPSEIGQLKSLETLSVEENILEKLPAQIGELKAIRMIHLEKNRLIELPPEIGRLTELQVLFLQENRLKTLPLELGQLRKLEVTYDLSGIYLTDNPLEHPYPLLIAGGQPSATRNVLAWLRGEIDPATLPVSVPASSEREEEEEDLSTPEEPALESGPTFSLRSGQLDLVPGLETDPTFDRATQKTLHNRIIRRIEPLRAETLKVGNRYPGLALSVEEYATLVSQPFDELDITDLWAVGNGLLAYAVSFEKQNQNRTLTEPLEPSHFALLLDVARLHAGFILGFPKAVELTERADHAQIAPDVFDLIDGPISNILSALSQNQRLVSERARHLAEALQAAMTVAGWRTTRVGYTGYVTVRNALIQLCKALVWSNDKGGSVVGSFAVGSVLAASGMSAETLQLVFQFLHFNASNMIAFAAPFPELRAWVGWIIDHLDKERLQRRDDASKLKI